jgi:glycosyltransferase involved in cell wall biosynthesis
MVNTQSIKISVIIPSFNQGDFISNAIKSVLGQTYSNWELIIQDGASNDNTSQICQSFAKVDERIKFFSEKDKGFADAVNKALEKATGTLAVIQSSDDFFATKTVFDDVIQVIESDKELNIITGSYVFVDKMLNHLSTVLRETGYLPAESIFTLQNHFMQGSTFFKVKRAREIGYLDSTIDIVADTDFFVRMSCYEPIAINALYQTTKIWNAVVVQDSQRSSDLSKFAIERVIMSWKHLNDNRIKYDHKFKSNSLNNHLISVIKFCKYHRIKYDKLNPIIKEFGMIKSEFGIILLVRKIRKKVKALFFKTNESSPLSFNEMFLNKPSINTYYNMKWFD